MRLTDVVVRNLCAPPTGWKIYLDDQLTGFGVRVTAAGVKAFVLTYGKQRERVTIGRYPIIGLAEAHGITPDSNRYFGLLSLRSPYTGYEDIP